MAWQDEKLFQASLLLRRDFTTIFQTVEYAGCRKLRGELEETTSNHIIEKITYLVGSGILQIRHDFDIRAYIRAYDNYAHTINKSHMHANASRSGNGVATRGVRLEPQRW